MYLTVFAILVSISDLFNINKAEEDTIHFSELKL